MCGICGIFDTRGVVRHRDILGRMNNKLFHRGPNGGGVKFFQNACLGHRRLSIIDLSKSGTQPIDNEDNSIAVTFNGEIYNYNKLRKDLISKGHIFKSDTDTEVLVHLYEEYGSGLLDYINGMYVFAIYDNNKKKLFISRDRLGQKPLFYFLKYHDGESLFAFSSELNSLAEHPEMPKALDTQSLHDYLSLQYIVGESSIYKNVKKLLPGCFLQISLSDPELNIQQYWQCSYKNKTSLSFNDASLQLRELLIDSVEKRLMSDVPLGAFLSGGLDSTLIVAIMRKILKIPVKTFTIAFDEKKYDESKFAAIAAEELNTEHFEKLVNPTDFSLLEKIVQQYGEPFADSSMLPTYLLSKFTKENVTVALSGDGADELFAGYYRYLAMKKSAKFDTVPYFFRKHLIYLLKNLMPPKKEERTFFGKLQRICDVIASKSNNRYFNMINRFPELVKHEIYTDEFSEECLYKTGRILQKYIENADACDNVEKIMQTDLLSYLPGDILVKVDIASMAHSLEVRSPFMDYRIAEFAGSLPLEFKQHGNTRKHILIEAFKDIIPTSVTERKKMGFGVPVAKWLRCEWKNDAMDCILNGFGVANGYFKQASLEKMFKMHSEERADFSYALWSLLVFELWVANKSAIK
jgi:asparagine synthase (glutamine-hydrolysing)